MDTSPWGRLRRSLPENAEPEVIEVGDLDPEMLSTIRVMTTAKRSHSANFDPTSDEDPTGAFTPQEMDRFRNALAEPNTPSLGNDPRFKIIDLGDDDLMERMDRNLEAAKERYRQEREAAASPTSTSPVQRFTGAWERTPDGKIRLIKKNVWYEMRKQ